MKALGIFAAIHFSVMDMSQNFQSPAWVEFFIRLREQGRAGVFVHGFLSLWFATMILAFHQVWSGMPMVLTLLGCAYLLKARHANRMRSICVLPVPRHNPVNAVIWAVSRAMRVFR